MPDNDAKPPTRTGPRDPWAVPVGRNGGISRIVGVFLVAFTILGTVVGTAFLADEFTFGEPGWWVVLILPGMVVTACGSAIASRIARRAARTHHDDDDPVAP